MVLTRSSIERAVLQQLTDIGSSRDEFAVARIIDVFQDAGVDDIDNIQIDEGGGDGDPFALHCKVGEVISDEPDSDGRLQLRIGVHLDRTWHEIETVSGDPGSAQVDDAERATEALLSSHGWVITGHWTNDEWEQWVAPVRRLD